MIRNGTGILIDLYDKDAIAMIRIFLGRFKNASEKSAGQTYCAASVASCSTAVFAQLRAWIRIGSTFPALLACIARLADSTVSPVLQHRMAHV